MIGARLLYTAWLATAKRHHRAFERGLCDPARAQESLLLRILRDNAESRAGRRFGFARIRSAAEFSRCVPTTTYDALEPDIHAIARGGSAVLTSEPVTRLLPSGGSTRGDKLVPFTRSLGRDFARAVGAWMVDLAASHPRIASGPAYWSVSPAMDSKRTSKVPIGFESDAAYLGRFLQPLVARTLVAPDALRHVRPLSAFQYATLVRLLATRELRLLSIWHPSFFDLVWKLRREVWDRALADIARGTLDLPLDASLRSALRSPPNPRRALELTGLGPEATIHEVFPSLALVSAWGDAAARAPFEALAASVRPAVAQPKGLLATEAFVTLPFDGRHPIALDSTFVELVDDRGTTRTVADAVVGEEYDVLVTTSGGLYRYRLGDRVVVDGFVDRTPSLRLLGRSDRVVDVVGEKLSETFVSRALECAYAPARLPAFAMLAHEGAAYTLFSSDSPESGTLARLEASLRENPCFAYARDAGQLGPIAHVRVPPDAGERYVADEHRRGRALGSIKPTHLAATRAWRTILGAEMHRSA